MLHYHLIMCEKYRNKVIDDTISNRLKEIFVKIAPACNIALEEWNHDIDHVHILFRGQPNTEISKFINAYKSAGSRIIKKEKLAKAQRRLSRMQGSKKHEDKSANYIKQLRKVNKIHRHIANQRLDNLHKISTEIANQYDVVCVESLNMKSMSNKGFGNGKATLDNGYGMFLSMLEYKLSDRDKYLVKVDRWFPSSQICHCCGVLHPEMKNLQIRKITCDCGLTISRDQNAAINILNEGLRLLSKVA